MVTFMLVFGKYNSEDVVMSDLGLAKYVGLNNKHVIHSFGVHAKKKFGVKEQNVVERLINKLMRSGQGRRKLGGHFIRGRGATGKKIMIMKEVEAAFDIIAAKTKKNPIQVLVIALERVSPNEDVTRLKKGGIAYTESVDVSPYNKINESLKNIALAVFSSTFNNSKTFSESLAEEIMLAAEGDPKSYAVKRKDEIERIAKGSR